MKIWHRHSTPDTPPARPGDMWLHTETPPVAQSGTPAPRICLGFSPPPTSLPAPLAATVMFVHMGKFCCAASVFRQVSLAGTVTEAATRFRRTAIVGPNSDEGTDSISDFSNWRETTQPRRRGFSFVGQECTVIRR